MSNPSSRQIYKEIQEVAIDFTKELGEALPENNYWAFSLYTQILPKILGEISNFVLPQSAVMGPTWNYLDAAAAGILGINQLLDKESHRPVATKASGFLNIGASAQLIALSTINIGLLGGPGFAAAFGTGFLISLDETARAFRRKYNFEYWLKDNLKQIEKIMELKEKLKRDITILEEAKTFKGATWAYKRKVQRLKKLEDEQVELENDVVFRVASRRLTNFENVSNSVDCYKFTPDPIVEKQLSACGEEFQKTSFINDLRKINNEELFNVDKLENKKYIPEINNALFETSRIHRENEIKTKCNNHVKSAVTNSIIWGVAFTGILLGCIPGMQLPALILVSAASAMYLAKNAKKIGDAFKKGFNYFFSKSKSTASNESQLDNTSVESNTAVGIAA